MIEANNPEIDVNELMEKIREEVARRESIVTPENNQSYIDKNIPVLNNIQNIEILLSNAEVKSQVRTEVPKKFTRFPFNLSKPLQRFALKVYAFLFKEQRVVNLSLIQAFRESLALNQKLLEQIKVFQLQVQELKLQVQELSDRINGTEQRLTVTEQRLTATDERYLKNDSYLKNDLTQQKRLITLFLEEARQHLPEPFKQEQIQTFINEEQHLLDAFYVAFEERFRGSREDILNRLKVYLPLIEEAKVGNQDSPILDVGCGRGEWLELLRESGYTARGIDINRVMVEECKTRELDASESDVITYLQSLPDASLGMVTGFHIIEHLPLELLIRLLNETVRVLKPGGLTIFETPNPQNILVGSNNFYIDPTHIKPLPSSLVEFLVEHIGFHPVKIINLNPYEESFQVNGSELANRFNSYFYGPQDYAVVGYKL